MIEEKLLAERVIDEVEKAVVGKREILTQIMTAILAGGHILIDDIPGTGKSFRRLFRTLPRCCRAGYES